MVATTLSSNHCRNLGKSSKEGRKQKKIEVFLEYHQLKEEVPGIEPVYLYGDQALVIQAWNMMEGKIIWPSLNDIAEYLEVADTEIFIDGLLLLQEHSQPIPE